MSPLAMGRMVPAWMCGKITLGASIVNSVSPLITAVIAGAPPL